MRYWFCLWLLIFSASLHAQNGNGAYLWKDLLKEWGSGQAQNTLSPTVVKPVKCGQVTRQAGFLHPTQQPARIVFQMTLPVVSPQEKLVLTAWGGVDDSAPRDDAQNPHDGVRFRVKVNDQLLDEVDCLTRGWVPISADMSAFAGKSVTLTLEVDSIENSNYDWASVAEPQILRLRERLSKFVGASLPPEGVLEIRGTTGKEYRLLPQESDLPPLTARLAGKPGEESVHWVRYAFPGARSAQFTRSVESGSVKVYSFSPKLQIKQVGSARALLAPGDTTELTVIVANVGLGTYTDASAQVTISGQRDVTELSSNQTETGILPPGDEKTFRFRVRVGNDPQLLAVLKSSAGSDAARARLTVAGRPANVPATGPVARAFGDHWALQNDQLRLLVSPSNQGTVARLYGRLANEWVLIGVMSPLAQAILNVEGAPEKSQTFRLTSATADETALRLILRGSLGPVADSTLEFRLNGANLETSGRLTAKQPAHLFAFVFPDWRIGDGGFGSNKNEALFPGLEYLLGNESSSGTEFAASPLNQRVYPHPFKVTMPLMAVRNQGWLLTMIWDPLQNWSGALKTPNPIFASPNFIDSQQNHRFALWAPPTPRWSDENRFPARDPFRMLKDQSVLIRAQIQARSQSKSITESLNYYVKQFGMPQPPAPQATDEPALQFSVKGLLNSWDSEKKAWKHTNTGPVYYDPLVALPLWALAHRSSTQEPYRSRAKEQVQAAVSAIAPRDMGWELSFYVGGLPSAMNRWREQIKQHIQRQREDGSWAWQPQQENQKPFGKPGDSSSGHTGQFATQIGAYALTTLDPEAQAALQKSLRYLQTQPRPEGAQTWELPLHVPDIMGSAHAVQSCLAAYEMNGDEKQLEQARYWALTGLPFVYFWNVPERPIMRGATIPVFGVTFLSQQPWFGVAVQWCGLVYANALYHLASHDKSLDWRKLAEAITLSAVQQQEFTFARYPQHEGFYPDAYSIVKGDEEYHWDLNPRLVAPALARRIGFQIEPRTIVLREPGEMTAVTMPGLVSVSRESGRLRIRYQTDLDLPVLHVLVASPKFERATDFQITFQGQEAQPVEDMEAFVWSSPTVVNGWALDRTQGWLMIRVKNPGTRGEIEVK
ncbi:MAG: hypothetical protein KIT45_04475 [Fimbriimonadia bacterium]|nr:hypothetical protein [Fimbriimonadia bacterium]